MRRKHDTFANGVTISLACYIGGAILCFLVFLVFGHPYIHAPAFYHIIAILVFFGGVGLLIISCFRLIQTTSGFYRGTLLVTFFVSLSAVVWFYFAVYNDDPVPLKEDPDNTVTYTLIDSVNFVGINGYGDTIYKKVGDSVLFVKMTRK